MEASFINTVAIPLWEDLASIFPALAPAVARMTSNSDIYQALTQLQPARIAQASPPSWALGAVKSWLGKTRLGHLRIEGSAKHCGSETTGQG